MIKRIAVACTVATLTMMPAFVHAQENDDTPVDVGDDNYPPGQERTLDVNGFSSECVKDAPWVTYSVATIGFTADPPVAKLTISDLNGELIEVLENQPLNGQFLYPGAAVDANGNATAWPGWEFNETTKEWIELEPGEGNSFWREGLKITVEVNPTGFTQVGYPDATPVCSGPNVTTSPPPPSEETAAATTSGTLPRTGSDGTSVFLQIGVLLLVAGGITLIATHRRRSSSAPAV